MLRNLKIWQKFTLIGVIVTVPLGLLLYFFVTEKNKAINFAQKERYGTTYLVPLRKLMEALPQYQRQLVENGDAGPALHQVELALTALNGAEQKYGKDLKTSAKLASLQGQWQNLQKSTNREERLVLLGQTMVSVRDLVNYVGDSSNLILDPDLDSYYAMDIMLLKLPEHQEGLMQLWALARDITVRKTLTADDRIQLLLLMGRIKANLTSTDHSLQVALANNPSNMLQPLAGPNHEHLQSVTEFLDLLEERLVKSNELTLTKDELDVAANKVQAAGFHFWDATNPALDNLLVARINGFSSERLLTLTTVGITLLLALFLTILIIRSITRPLKKAVAIASNLAQGKVTQTTDARFGGEAGQLLQAMNTMTEYLNEMADAAGKIAQGDLSVKIMPLSNEDVFGSAFARMSAYLEQMAFISDEIARGNLKVRLMPNSAYDRFGHSFQNMLERTLRLVQSQAERDRIQDSIMKLLNEVSDVALGDLTVQAEVTADMTGAIADAFNMMIGELRQLIYKVKDTTFRVNKSTEQIQLAMDELASGSEFQAAQIKNTTEAMQLMAASIQQVSQNAAQSADVAQQSLTSSRKGAEAVHNNIAAIMRVREQVQETANRIKRLGERSQEIGSSVQLIKDIATRTSMLALNASIQAGMAGEAGRGFVVVAEEIESLAERAANVTKQISSLVHSIQGETRDVLAAMDTTTREVAVGSVRANEAGQALNEIEAVSQQLARLIQSISQAATHQANGSDAIAKSMGEVSNVTRRVANGSQRTATSVHELVLLTDALRSSVVTFRLPDKLGTNSPGTPTPLDSAHRSATGTYVIDVTPALPST